MEHKKQSSTCLGRGRSGQECREEGAGPPLPSRRRCTWKSEDCEMFDNGWFCLLFVDKRSTYPGCRIPRHRGEHRQGKDICHWGTSGCSAPSSRGFPRHCHRCPPPSCCPPPPARGPRCRTCCALWGAAGQQCLGLHCPDRYRLSGKLILSCLRVACIVFFVLPFFVHKLFLKLNIIYLGHI